MEQSLEKQRDNLVKALYKLVEISNPAELENVDLIHMQIFKPAEYNELRGEATANFKHEQRKTRQLLDEPER